jgi:hypothetical protein
MRPDLTAALDQADAGTAHAAAVVHRLAALEGGTVVTTGRISRPLGALLHRLATRTEASGLSLCPHLSWGSAQPCWWVACKPGRLRCADCADTAQRQIRGTPEDTRCDVCRRSVRRIHPDAAQLPAIVVDVGDRSLTLPPVIAVFGLCADRCHPEFLAAEPLPGQDIDEKGSSQ